jgi:hypothetical protein
MKLKPDYQLAYTENKVISTKKQSYFNEKINLKLLLFAARKPTTV